jgi:glutathione S-transferase
MEQDSVDPSRFPKIKDHRERMAERPTVKMAIAEELA